MVPAVRSQGRSVHTDEVRRLFDLFMPNELPIIIVDAFDKSEGRRAALL